jgi:hypothetical protein
MIRTTLGMLIGIVIAALAIYGAQYGYTSLYPPPGSAAGTPEALVRFVFKARPNELLAYAFGAPQNAVWCILGGWAGAGLIGGWIAAAIAKPHRGAAATLVGALVTIGVLVYGVLMPNADWITVVGVLLPIPFALIGGRLAMPRREF